MQYILTEKELAEIKDGKNLKKVKEMEGQIAELQAIIDVFMKPQNITAGFNTGSIGRDKVFYIQYDEKSLGSKISNKLMRLIKG